MVSSTLMKLFNIHSKCSLALRLGNHAMQINRKKAVPITLDEAEDYVNFLVLTLDTTIKMMPSGVEKWIWILDLNGM